MSLNFEIEKRFFSTQCKWEIIFFHASMTQGVMLVEEGRDIQRARDQIAQRHHEETPSWQIFGVAFLFMVTEIFKKRQG